MMRAGLVETGEGRAQTESGTDSPKITELEGRISRLRALMFGYGETHDRIDVIWCRLSGNNKAPVEVEAKKGTENCGALEEFAWILGIMEQRQTDITASLEELENLI